MDAFGEVIDRDHLERATGGDASLMAELLGMLRDELPSRKRHLDERLEKRDWEGAAEAAHKMRGAGSYTGALALERAAGRLEERLRARDEPGAAAALEDLEDRLKALEAALESNAINP